MSRKTTTHAQASALLERYRLAVIAYRAAIYSISYRMSGSPNFGEIPLRYVEEYERARLALLEAEREVEDNRFSFKK